MAVLIWIQTVDTLIVFLKEFFENIHFGRSQQTAKTQHANSSHLSPAIHVTGCLLGLLLNFVFVWVDSLQLGQQLCSHVGKFSWFEPVLSSVDSLLLMFFGSLYNFIGLPYFSGFLK